MRQAARSQGLLWLVRMLILAMLALGLAVLYHRHHLSDEQRELLRYVEVDVATLRKREDPIEAQLSAWLGDPRQSREQARAQLVDEVIPQLIQLRKAAELPVQAAQTPVVKGLASEYQEVVAALIEACRTAVRVIDDQAPGRDPHAGLVQIRAGFAAAAARSRTWESHVKQVSQALHLSR